MTTPIEFDVPEQGTPNLEDSPTDDQSPDQPALTAIAAPVGWTPEEAAHVVGGAVSLITTAMYLVKYHQPPAAELVPMIAGNPPLEFPLMGAGLAPILDLVAPKGSAAAVGVSLGAGVSELMGAMARRMPVMAIAPKQKPAAPVGNPANQPPAAAPPEPPSNGGFRFRRDELSVLQDQDAYASMGVA